MTKIAHDDRLLSEPSLEVNGNDQQCKTVNIILKNDDGHRAKIESSSS